MASPSMGRVIKRLGAEGTSHGMRSAFADWSREVAKADRETRELALAHRKKSGTVGAYSRSDLLESRRTLMAAWAAHVTGAPAA